MTAALLDTSRDTIFDLGHPKNGNQRFERPAQGHHEGAAV
jgi:hypothetical protein